MLGTSVKTFHVCLAAVEGSGVHPFRPCIDNVILPSILLAYIAVWSLVDIGILTAQFWKKFWKAIHDALKNILNVFKFFCLWFRQSKQRHLNADKSMSQNIDTRLNEVEGDPWSVKDDVHLISTVSNLGTEASFINPNCGNCEKCISNPLCPMKAWQELRLLRRCSDIFKLSAIIPGSIGLAFNLLLLALPENPLPNTDATDRVLQKFVEFAPDWSIAIQGSILATIAFLISALIKRQMNMIPASLCLYSKLIKTNKATAFFAVHITCYTVLLSVALTPSTVSVMSGWIRLQSSENPIPSSITWTFLLVLIWLTVVIGAARMVRVSVQAVKRCRTVGSPLRKSTVSTPADSESTPSATSDHAHSSSLLTPDSSWILNTPEAKDGCGCGCCSRTRMFRIDRNPLEDKASIVSRLTFSWISPLIALGYMRPLAIDDLAAVPSHVESQKAESRFLDLWSAEAATSGASVTSLVRVCFRFNMFPLILATLYKLCYDTLSFGCLLILTRLIKHLEKCAQLNDDAAVEESSSIGYLFADGVGMVLLLLAIKCLMSVLLQQYFHTQFKAGMSTRAALVGFIYSKALKISSGLRPSIPNSDETSETSTDDEADWFLDDKKKGGKKKKRPKQKKKKKLKQTKDRASTEATTTGEMVNLMSVDAQFLQELLPWLCLVWSSPYQILLAFILLWRELGVSMLGGAALMGLSLHLTIVVGWKIETRQATLMSLRDERMKITNEVFSGMKIIKLYAWEESFRKKVNHMRDRELSGLWTYSLLTMASMTLWIIVPVFVSLVSFLIYVAIGNRLTPSKAFTAIALFNLMRYPLHVFPNVIGMVIQARVAVTRIASFISKPEVPELSAPPHHPVNDPSKPSVVMNNLSVQFANGSPAVTAVTVSCFPGRVTAIIGKTGSGKSALLRAIIGDLQPEPSATLSSELPIRITGRIAYVAQTPWILNATLRENILFGQPYNRRWYAKVIHVCALKPDIDILPVGDLTEIGEKGVNLSGGQKQRVSLARAVYHCKMSPDVSELPSDIYVLDDCLSAVDSHVGRHIFEKCILELLRHMNRTVILVTHKLDILPKVDHIVFLSRETLDANHQCFGKVVAQGTQAELMLNAEYINFIKEAKAEEEEQIVRETGMAVLDQPGAEHPEAFASLPQHADGLSDGVSFVDDDGLMNEDDGFEKRTTPTALKRDSTTLSDLLTLSKSKEEKGDQSRLIDAEKVYQGAVQSAVYQSYFDGLGGPVIVGLVLLAAALSEGSRVASNAWISYWSDHSDRIPGLPTGILVYSGLSILQVVLVTVASLIAVFASQKASRYFHEGLIARLLRAPMAFFDATPMGRILTRFSKDLYTIDVALPQTIIFYIINLFAVVATFGVIITAIPYFALVCMPLLLFYYYVKDYYIPCSRQLQRADSVLRSPIFSHFSETLDGVPTIRAYRAQSRFKAMNTKKVDSQQRAYYLLVVSNRWLAIRIEMLGTIVAMASSLLAVYGGLRGTISPGVGGLIITYALNITQSLNWMIRSSSDQESHIVSVERVCEYSESIPEELSAVIEGHRPSPTWPENGIIQFDNYQLAYRPTLPLVIKGLSLTIPAHQRVGIVGRTGAGKSSLFIGLLRLVEPSGGKITVDGLNISEIGLFDLRSKLGIIPQEPVLFTGTLRFNLDPFESHADPEICQALERTHLKSFVENDFPGGLDGVVEEGGKNLSMGQRQLICLARALLRKSQILLFDEATSAVDPLTDRLIQVTIREEFQNCTILTIAHRLGTVLDYDNILVLDSGVMKEYGSPTDLMNREGGIFRSLCIDAGITVG